MSLFQGVVPSSTRGFSSVDIYNGFAFCIDKNRLSSNYRNSLYFQYQFNFAWNYPEDTNQLSAVMGYKVLHSNTFLNLSTLSQVDFYNLYNNSSWISNDLNETHLLLPSSEYSHEEDFTIYNFKQIDFSSDFRYTYVFALIDDSTTNYRSFDVSCFGCDSSTITYSDTYESGYKQGFSNGSTEGYNNGYSEGENIGYTEGHRIGYDLGYSEGFNEDNNFTDLFIAIGETPVNTFKNILNFDILGVNVAQFILSLLTFFIVLFGIKKLL